MAALTSAVTHMAEVLSPPPSTSLPAEGSSGSSSAAAVSATGSSSIPVSPAKLASLRSNYLQQMRDVHSLFECGAISESEFREQKAPILEQLKKLVPD